MKKHGGKISRSAYFKGKWIAKCRCGYTVIGPLRAVRKMAKDHGKD